MRRSRSCRPSIALRTSFSPAAFSKRQLYDLLGNLLGDDQYAVNIAEDDISVVYGYLTNFDWAAELHHLSAHTGILRIAAAAEHRPVLRKNLQGLCASR